MNRFAVNLERRVDRAQEVGRDLDRIGRGTELLAHDDELVAAETANGVG